MPPRHGKSELCSQYFPAWYLGRHPDQRVMLASYESTFAQDWGEKTRDVLQAVGPEVFGVAVHSRRTRAGDWRLAGNHKGRMMCAGVTGGFTGRGANLFIIDDPVKNAQEAQSETFRQRVWDFYQTAAKTRLEPDGLVIVIMTRWHQDDLVGRLRKQMQIGGEQWDSITLPALCEAPPDPLPAGWRPDMLGRRPGEALWPWRYPAATLLEMKRGSPEHWWNALYQQRPTPPGGSLAKETWFGIVGALPADVPLQRCRFWDCAGTEETGDGNDPDWTVGAKLARDGGRYYIEDIIRVHRSHGEVNQLIHQTALLDGPAVVIREEQEPGSSGKAVIGTRKTMLAGFNYRGVPPRGEKSTRWIPMLNQAEVGNVKIVSDWGSERKWNVPFLAEVSAAPHGEHDDQLDAVSGSFQTLALETAASLDENAPYPLYH